MMKHNNFKSNIVKQSIVLSLLAASLTGCIVSPYDDYSNREHGRYDRGPNDSQRYDRNDRRNSRNHERPNKPTWNQDHNRHDSNANRPR